MNTPYTAAIIDSMWLDVASKKAITLVYSVVEERTLRGRREDTCWCQLDSIQVTIDDVVCDNDDDDDEAYDHEEDELIEWVTSVIMAVLLFYWWSLEEVSNMYTM